MMEYDTIFRMFNLARELSFKTRHERIGLNERFLQSYDYGYICSQLTMIRRIACDPDKNVISLTRVLRDIQEHAHLITRENYVGYQGLPYDSIGNPNNWLSQLRHEAFDRLCGNSDPSYRDRGQTVPIPLFKTVLSTKLMSCNHIKPVVNNFIAHAGDFETRVKKGLMSDRIAVSLNKIAECHKEVCQMFYFISGHLLGFAESSLSLIPPTYGNPSENMDKAFVLAEDLNKLNDFWTGQEKIVELWNQEVTSGRWLKSPLD